MDAIIAVTITAGVVAVSGVLALLLRSASGRTRPGDGSVFRPGQFPGLAEFGRTATLVQFSTEFCAQCPGTRRVLHRLSAGRDDVRYVDVDLTNEPALASALRILQTPTVFVLDRDGRLVTRIGGAPRLGALIETLDDLSSRDSRDAHPTRVTEGPSS